MNRDCNKNKNESRWRRRNGALFFSLLLAAASAVSLLAAPPVTAWASDSRVETVLLGSPKHVWWETDTTGAWSPVSRAGEYQVKLYIADNIERDEENWKKVDFDDEGMEEAECVMTKRTSETSCDFAEYMDDLHTYFFVVRATPTVGQQAYVENGSWAASPDVDFRELQVQGVTGGRWRNYLEGSKYETEDGAFLPGGWQLIQGSWYLLDEQGFRLNGWQQEDGAWYYLDEQGRMATGWFVWEGSWYYADDAGRMQTGRVMTQPGVYYELGEDGRWQE